MTGTGELYANCARHAEAAAGFRCIECGELLCQQCIEIGSHLIFCGLCGERAIELDEWERPQPALAGPAARTNATRRLDELRTQTAQLKEVPPSAPAETSASSPPEVTAPPALGDRIRRDPPPRPRPVVATATEPVERLSHTGPAVFIINHAVIPTATIAMVAALLFFLLDVRSVFLTGTEALKWVGFCFVTATVLIARYGRASANAERQGCYTLALAGATVVAMTVSPWANPSGGYSGSVVNLLIILVVWRFATRLTHRLSFEGARMKEPKPRLYGTERLRLEQWQSATSEGGQGNHRDEIPEPEPETREGGDNPVVPVARLAAAGLLAFALGEPFLLAGPPAAGERALGAMIAFLLAGGVVLAAGSGLGTLRRVRALGGRASLTMLPGRIATAGGVMVMLAALALTLPGIDVRGTGSLRPASPGSGAEGGDSGQAKDEGGDSEQPQKAAETQGEASSNDRKASSEPPAEQTRGPSRAAASLVGQMAELGKWLRYVVIVLAALFALWGLWWFLNHLASASAWLSQTMRNLLRQLHASIAGFLQQLSIGLGRLFRRRVRKQRTPQVDPFADWEVLRRLQPREAIVAAYGRLLAVFELLDHPHRERQTPYEFLASIPGRLKRLSDPAENLTEAYVKTAYSGTSVGEADRQRALDALEEIRLHVTQMQAQE